MNTMKARSMCIAVSAAAAIALSGCASSDFDKDRADMAEADLAALQEAFGADELTPDTIAALHAMVAELMGRADITPQDLQDLRDMVAMLEGRADITPAELQTLEDALTQALEPSWTPLASGVYLDYSASTSQQTGDTVAMIESNRRDTYHVTYMVDGVEQRIQFTPDEYSFPDEGYFQPGNPGYWLWDESQSFTVAPEFKYFNVNGWWVEEFETLPNGSNGDLLNRRHGYVVYGTPTATLPVAGTAAYEGRMFANSFLRTDPNFGTGRNRYLGAVTLTADFDTSTVDGMVDRMSVRSPDQRSYVPTTAEIQIQSGMIAGGEFSADLEGLHDLAGLNGTATGQFFGPEAEEVGGVISAEDADAVYNGYFGGKKQ